VKDNGLGGAMIWSVETDDFLGVCGAGRFPLLVAINSVLTGKTSAAQVKSNCCDDHEKSPCWVSESVK
jgi:hypothetical protein